MGDHRLQKRVMYGKIAGGIKGRGRPEINWDRCLADDLECFGIQVTDWAQATSCRQTWIACVASGAQRFMRDWQKKTAAEMVARHAKVTLAILPFHSFRDELATLFED